MDANNIVSLNSLNYMQGELFKKTLQYIRSSTFRNPIKNFVDQNCKTFEDGESLPEHNELHKVFFFFNLRNLKC